MAYKAGNEEGAKAPFEKIKATIMPLLSLVGSLSGLIGGILYLHYNEVIDLGKIEGGLGWTALGAIIVAYFGLPVLMYVWVYAQAPWILREKAWKYVIKNLPTEKTAVGLKWYVHPLHERNASSFYTLQGPLCDKCTSVMQKVLTKVYPLEGIRKYAYRCPECPEDEALQAQIPERKVDKSMQAAFNQLKHEVSELKDKALKIRR